MGIGYVKSVQCTDVVNALLEQQEKNKSVYFVILVSNGSTESAHFLQKKILIK